MTEAEKQARLLEIKAELSSVSIAIQDCLKAQSYSIAGRSKNMASLNDLKSLRQDLTRELRQLEGKGMQVSYGILE